MRHEGKNSKHERECGGTRAHCLDAAGMGLAPKQGGQMASDDGSKVNKGQGEESGPFSALTRRDFLKVAGVGGAALGMAGGLTGLLPLAARAAAAAEAAAPAPEPPGV